MDDLNDVVSMIIECGLVGSHIALHIDTDNMPAWVMHIHTFGGDYQLSTYSNGGYLLVGPVVTPQALVTSNTEGVVGITMDPEEYACQIYLPKLSKEVLKRSLASLRSIRMAHIRNTN